MLQVIVAGTLGAEFQKHGADLPHDVSIAMLVVCAPPWLLNWLCLKFSRQALSCRQRIPESLCAFAQIICIYICGHAYGWGPIGWLYPTCASPIVASFISIACLRSAAHRNPYDILNGLNALQPCSTIILNRIAMMVLSCSHVHHQGWVCTDGVN